MDKEFFNEINEINNKLKNLKSEQKDLMDKLKSYFLEFNKDTFEGIDISDLTTFINDYRWLFSKGFEESIDEYSKDLCIKNFGAIQYYPFINNFTELIDKQKFEIDRYFYELPSHHKFKLDIVLDQLYHIGSLKDVSQLIFINIIKELHRTEIIELSYIFRCEYGDDMNYIILSKSELLEILGEFDNYEMRDYIKTELCPDCDCACGCLEEENLEENFNKAVKRIMKNPWDADYIVITKVK